MTTYLALANVPGAYCESYTADPHIDLWEDVTFDVEVHLWGGGYSAYTIRSRYPHVWIPGFTEKHIDRLIKEDPQSMHLKSKDGNFFAGIVIQSASFDPLSHTWTAQYELKSFHKNFLRLRPEYGSTGKSEASLGLTYLDVPFNQKDEAKLLGARWSESMGLWYIPKDLDRTPFERWLIERSAPY
jgi:hypothetical protein